MEDYYDETEIYDDYGEVEPMENEDDQDEDIVFDFGGGGEQQPREGDQRE